MTKSYISEQWPTTIGLKDYEALEWVEIGELTEERLSPLEFEAQYKQEPIPSKE